MVTQGLMQNKEWSTEQNIVLTSIKHTREDERN